MLVIQHANDDLGFRAIFEVRVQGEGGVQEEAEYYEYYGEDDDEYFARIQEEGEEEEYDLLPPGSSFIRDSAEMNAV